MSYKVVKDLRAEVKVGANLFLKDLFALVCYPFAIWMLSEPMISDPLMPLYIGYNIAVILLLLQRPKSNPGKQVYQILLFLIRQDTNTYHMIHPDQNAEEKRHEME